MKKLKRFKPWHVTLIKNFAKYEAQKLTWKQIALEVDASWTAVETFVRRHKGLFDAEYFANKVEAFEKQIDEYLSKHTDVEIDETINKYLGKSKVVFPKKKSPAKILILDIETAPIAGYVFQLWKQNISLSQLLNSGNYFMLTWSAKWLFEDNMMNDRLTGNEALIEDDARITKSMWHLVNEADIIVGHYISGFDAPMLNSRFIMHGLNPPSPYQIIDTKLHASKQFRFPSNKLDYLATQLLGAKKIKTDFELWANCLKGDEMALEQMQLYNDMDTKLAEELYLAIRAYIKPHPNIGLFIESDVPVCPSCGSKHLTWGNTYYTTMNSYDAFSCDECGSQGRSRKANTSKELKDRLTSSLPK